MAGGIDSLETIPGLLKRLQIRVQLSQRSFVGATGSEFRNKQFRYSPRSTLTSTKVNRTFSIQKLLINFVFEINYSVSPYFCCRISVFPLVNLVENLISEDYDSYVILILTGWETLLALLRSVKITKICSIYGISTYVIA
jgi:hypothetical protein